MMMQTHSQMARQQQITPVHRICEICSQVENTDEETRQPLLDFMYLILVSLYFSVNKRDSVVGSQRETVV